MSSSGARKGRKDRIQAIDPIWERLKADGEISREMTEDAFQKAGFPIDGHFARTLRKAVKDYNDLLGAAQIDVSDSLGLRHIPPNVSTFGSRLEKNRLDKDLVAKILLHWLFDSNRSSACYDCSSSTSFRDVIPKGENYALPEGVQVKCNWARSDIEQSSIERRLRRKRDALRDRTVLSMLVDSGSTTYSFVSQFLDTKFPLSISGSGDGRKMVEPSIMTNSIPIAELIGTPNNPYRRNMTLRVIGGTERPERRSLSGDMSILWARTLRSLGGVDLCVIGTTGIDQNPSSSWSLYMDEPFECELKREFLQMANFRIIICDYSKISRGSSLHKISPVTLQEVDLIVTNYPNRDRTDTYEEDISKFDKFFAEARIDDVGVIAVRKK